MRIFSSNEFGKRRRPSPPPPPRKRQRKHLHRKRREKRERHSRLVRDRERSRPTDDDDDTRVLKNCERERENFRILRTPKKREEVSATIMRNGVKTSARTTLLPPPLLPPPGKKVDFRAGFFSTSSSANRFGVGARRALFLSLMMYVVSSLARQQSLCASFFRSIPVFGPFFFPKTLNPK